MVMANMASKVYIKTFGNFDIIVRGNSILTSGIRQQGFLRLLVFFLLNRDKVFNTNVLIEKVWPNKEYHDNNAVMRTQIFRLKKHLAEMAPDLEFKLEFMHGGYFFSIDEKNIVIDTDVFQKLYDSIVASAMASDDALAKTRFSGAPVAASPHGSETRVGVNRSFAPIVQGAARVQQMAEAQQAIKDDDARRARESMGRHGYMHADSRAHSDSGGHRSQGSGRSRPLPERDASRIRSVFIAPTTPYATSASERALERAPTYAHHSSRERASERAPTYSHNSSKDKAGERQPTYPHRSAREPADAKRAAQAAVDAALSGQFAPSRMRQAQSQAAPPEPVAKGGGRHAISSASARSAARMPSQTVSAFTHATAQQPAMGSRSYAGSQYMSQAPGAQLAQEPEPIRYADEDMILMCKEAFGVYQDGFLREDAFDGEWVTLHKLNYRRMWFRLVELFTNLCFRNKRYDEVIALCQQALQFEGMEEYIHEIYMDALRNAGYVSDAIGHYESITTTHRRGEAFSNSTRLKEIYRSAVRDLDHRQLVDRNDIERFLFDLAEERGALICGKDDFLGHCRLVKQFSDRAACDAFICIVEIVDMESKGSIYRKLCDTDYLAPIFARALRSSDAICNWNDKQILILIVCEQQMDVGGLLRRVMQEVINDNSEDKEAVELLKGGVRQLPLSLRMLPFGEGSRQAKVYEREPTNE